MDAPTQELAQIRALLKQARAALLDGQPQAALDAAQQVPALDPNNSAARSLMAEACEALGRPEDAQRFRAQEKALKREAWQRQVEAEARGEHELLGEAIRHENL